MRYTAIGVSSTLATAQARAPARPEIVPKPSDSGCPPLTSSGPAIMVSASTTITPAAAYPSGMTVTSKAAYHNSRHPAGSQRRAYGALAGLRAGR